MGTNANLIQRYVYVGREGAVFITVSSLQTSPSAWPSATLQPLLTGRVSKSTTQAMCSFGPFLLSIQGLQKSGLGAIHHQHPDNPKQAGSPHNLVFSGRQPQPPPFCGKNSLPELLTRGMNKKECGARRSLR